MILLNEFRLLSKTVRKRFYRMNCGVNPNNFVWYFVYMNSSLWTNERIIEHFKRFKSNSSIMASDWNLLVICRKAHEFFKYWRCQPGIECSNVTRISKNEWENDIFHFNVVQWNPFQIWFNLLEVECPVDFDDGNRSMRENWMIWIKIKCESTHEWRNFIVTLRNFFTYVNIASTEPTIDKLKMKYCQITLCWW